MSHISPLTIKHIDLRTAKPTAQEQIALLTSQVVKLRTALAAARQEIEFLTAERDELVTAIKEWSAEDWSDQVA